MKKNIMIGILLALCVALLTSTPFNKWISIGRPSGSYDVYTYYDSEWNVVVYATQHGICAVKVR